MIKQRVLFDMDGCLVNMIGGISAFISNNYKDIYWSNEHVLQWDIFSSIPDKIASVNAFEHMKSRGFFRNLEAVHQAIIAYQTLEKLGHNVAVCTTPLPWDNYKEQSMSDKQEWVKQYLGDKAADKIIFSFDKTRECANIIIDDKPDLTLGKQDIKFKHWLIVDHVYNRNLPKVDFLPIGRILNDWSNWQEEFVKLELI